MSNTQTRWILASSLLAALAGCDVTVHDCDKEPEAKICQDDFDDEDASDDETIDDEDADIDAGKVDSGRTDASRDGATSTDGATNSEAGSDAASNPDSSSAPITVDEFCVAQLATAVAWRDALEGLCGGSKESAAREAFLQEMFAYGATDAEGKCIADRKAPITAGNTVFDGSKAMACASTFAGSFMAPPDPFPTDGIDLAMYEAKIGHGVATLAQIPACRAAFKGKLARDKPCTDAFECVDGLRCIAAPGGTRTCQPALVGGTCSRSSECADQYVCVGNETSGGGKTCVKNDALPMSGGNCTYSFECATDYVCNASSKCATPTAQLICKP